jgi:hypothetical protein
MNQTRQPQGFWLQKSRSNCMNKTLERILPRVQKPARYTGGEYNQVIKDLDGSTRGSPCAFPTRMKSACRISA